MKLGVIGGGTMGGGIAQVAAQQGMDVVLLDVRQDLLDASVARIKSFLQRNVERGRMSQDELDAAVGRIVTTTDFSGLADVDAVIEAALEEVNAKSEIFRQLDANCPADAILASNTSSLSITEIAAATTRPQRVVGMHFFNPVPLMALVEVVKGHSTSDATMNRAVDLARFLGKTPVRAADTPGFVVNRIVRPFYNEALRILGDGVASYPEIDRVMKGAGFRMGPFELMDLIGNDVNLAVTASIFNQLYGEPKLRPSFHQQRIVQSGNLGQKAKRGWYAYDGSGDGPKAPTDVAVEPLHVPVAVVADSELGVELADALAESTPQVKLYVTHRAEAPTTEPHVASLAEALAGAGLIVDVTSDPDRKHDLVRDIIAEGAAHVPLVSCSLVVSATEIGSWHLDPGVVCGFGFLPPLADAKVLEIAPGLETREEARRAAYALAGALGRDAVHVGDGSGLIAARIVALIANEAAFALMEGIATADDIDAAVRLGANYPHGPLEWADLMGVDLVYAIIKGMYEEYGEDRYRPAPTLRRMVLAGRTGRAAGRGFFSYA
jgi:3-hydroxybutyryl-CoA dehydrogenase